MSDRHDLDTATAIVDANQPFCIGSWTVDPRRRVAESEGQSIRIDPRNLRVLQILAKRQGQIVSPREIEQFAWEGVVVTPDSLYQSIRQLRQALGDSKDPPKYIETVPRKGYRLVAEVQPLSASKRRDLPHKDNEGLIGVPTSKPSKFRRARGLLLVVAAFCLAVLIAAAIKLTTEKSALFNQDARAPKSGTKHLDVSSLRALGSVELSEGNARDAIVYFERALALQIASAGEQDVVVIKLLAQIASSHLWLDDQIAAKNAALKALSLLDRLPPRSPDRIVASSELAEYLIDAGDYESAEPLIDAALELAAELYGDRSLSLYSPLLAQSRLHWAMGDLGAAKTDLSRAIEITSMTRGSLDQRIGHLRTGLAFVLLDEGDAVASEREARLALGVLEHAVDAYHPYVSSAKHVLAEALAEQGRFSEVEPILRMELMALQKAAASDLRLARAARALGGVLVRQGGVREGRNYLGLADRKLQRRKGWPQEREVRLLDQYLRRLASTQMVSGQTLASTDAE